MLVSRHSAPVQHARNVAQIMVVRLVEKSASTTYWYIYKRL